jgi:Flp pilus assembly pilin Flp
MKNLLAEVMRDESGLILSAELVLILTICVLGIVVGLVQVQTAVVSEFQDLALAFSSLNQSYSTVTFMGCRKWRWGATSFTAGSGFIDIFDGCIGSSWNGGMVGGSFGGGGGGYGGGYSEIGGMGYSGTSSSTATPGVVNPQVAPCDTCTPSSVTTTPYPGCDSLAPSTATQPSLQTPTPLPPPPVPTKD